MDWSDEAKARLEADISGEPFDGVYLLTRQRADIRAALGEIERRRAEAAAAWKSAIHNKERAEKAEAENDGLRHSLTDAADQLAQHQHDAQIKYDSLWDEASVMLMDEVHDHALTMDNLKGRCELAEAEAERLREALESIIKVQDDQTIWPAYSNEKGKRMGAAIENARTALRGGGE